MSRPSHEDQPLRKLEHEAVPGYRLAFAIAFFVMALYLAAVLVSSPGSAKGDGDHGKPHEIHPNNGSETKSRPH